MDAENAMVNLHGDAIVTKETNTSNITVDMFYDNETQSDLHAYNSISKRKISDVNELESESKKGYVVIDMDEKILMSAIWGLMIDEGLPPSLFASENFQALLEPICEAISEQQNNKIEIDMAETESLLCLVAKHICNVFSKNLDGRLLSLKIEMNLNEPDERFCVSTLFIQQSELETLNLGVRSLKNNQQLTEEDINQVLEKYNIDTDQVISVCCGINKSKHNIPVKRSEYLREIENFEKFPNISFANLKVERFVGDIAQLCLLDIFKNWDIFQEFWNCRNFIKIIISSTKIFSGIFEKNNLNVPQMDSPWRWGSTYKMMQDLQKSRSILNDFEYPEINDRDNEFTVDENMWEFVEAFCVSLCFIQKSILKYYFNEMHFGDFYTQWIKCKLLTSKLYASAEKQNVYVTIITKELLKSIEVRSKALLGRDNFKACLYLDPRFQHTLQSEEKSQALEYLKKLWNLSKIDNPITANPSSLSDEYAFLNKALNPDDHEPATTILDIYSKIESFKLPFQSVNTNILLFWHRLRQTEPDMYLLSTICYTIPITQNYNKGYNPYYNNTQSTLKLSELTKENLETIRLNSHLVDFLRLENFCKDHSTDGKLS